VAGPGSAVMAVLVPYVIEPACIPLMGAPPA
jgi:hypothetical protein